MLTAWLAFLAGMFGRYAWWLDLFAHFRVHYAFAFAALACAALAMRAKLAAAAAVLGFAVSLAPLTSYIEPFPKSAAASAANFRLVSLNVRFRTANLAPAAAFLEQASADVVVLQEVTQAQARMLEPLLASYPHRRVDPDWRGAAIYSRWPLAAAQWLPLAEGASRGAYVQIDWRGTRIALLGVHLHWPLIPREAQLRDRQFAALAAWAAEQTEPLIVAGDLNVTPWSPHFRAALTRSGLRDCALGQGLSPSWPSQAIWLGIRIDHCLASPHWRVHDLRVGPDLGSDHRPVVVDLALGTNR